MAEPVVVDLPDFIPEEYVLRFKIAGREYEFAYQEATVDEVFRILAESATKDVMASRRAAVLGFLKKVIRKGDAAQIEQDFALLPYISPSGQLDVCRLYDQITVRVKKNDLGASPEAT